MFVAGQVLSAGKEYPWPHGSDSTGPCKQEVSSIVPAGPRKERGVNPQTQGHHHLILWVWLPDLPHYHCIHVGVGYFPMGHMTNPQSHMTYDFYLYTYNWVT